VPFATTRDVEGRRKKRPKLVFDNDLLVDLPDARPALGEIWVEFEWNARHWRVAWRSAGRDFDAHSLALFADLLDGRSVADVARRHATSTQAVHKVKQRLTRRLRELVARSIENERRSR
jgi:hypothetical protein